MNKRQRKKLAKNQWKPMYGFIKSKSCELTSPVMDVDRADGHDFCYFFRIGKDGKFTRVDPIP